MPVWCKMFHQTLDRAAQNWFDDLDPKSVNSFKELSQKFLKEFSQQKRYAKDPIEIHGIKRRQNEGLQTFMDWFKSKSSHIKGVPPVLRILAFMHGHGHSELAKKLNDKIPKTVDEMFERGKAFIRGEVAIGSAEMVKTQKMQSSNGRFFRRNTSSPESNRSSSNYRKSRKKIREQVILRTKSSSKRGPNSGPVSLEKTWDKEDIEEVCIISHERPDQHITMRTTLIADCKKLLTKVLRENIDVFAWARSERTVVLRFVMEHQLNIYPFAKPVIHKRRPMTPDGRLVLKEEVFRWLKEGMIRKDMYPFPEEGEGLASIMGYAYKCFLRLSKEYSQIIMTEDDEEKTGFHTKEGVYCFTHMPKELKNSEATLQRMIEKVLAD
ncbi:reverse transcriptase domain-containing protein [Tanacetum coccineum]